MQLDSGKWWAGAWPGYPLPTKPQRLRTAALEQMGPLVEKSRKSLTYNWCLTGVQYHSQLVKSYLQPSPEVMATAAPLWLFIVTTGLPAMSPTPVPTGLSFPHRVPTGLSPHQITAGLSFPYQVPAGISTPRSSQSFSSSVGSPQTLSLIPTPPDPIPSSNIF